MKKYFTAGIITIIMLSTVGILVSAQLEFGYWIPIKISNATIDELTQKLDAAITDIQIRTGKDIGMIQLHCTLEYPPAPGSSGDEIWCRVSE
jgi:hypothetical protein